MRWLSWTLWTPIAGVVVLAFLPKAKHELIRWWTLLVSVVAFAFSIGILVNFRTGVGGLQMVERATWIRQFGASYHLGVDGISLFLVLLTTFLLPVCVLASWKVDKNPKMFMGLLLALESAVIGVFLSLDLLLFYLFWEAMLVPMYFLIGYWGHERRIYAAVKFFLFTLLGGVLMLAGILVTVFTASRELGGITFDLTKLQNVTFAGSTGRWLFLAFFAAFAIKIPLFPVHTWLPDAHTEAPTAGSVILAGVLLKMGGYGILRFAIGLFPAVAREFAPWIAALAIIGIIYGALVAMMQRDLKRLVAYSSVSHLGFVVLGIFAFSLTSMQGASLQMINHGLATGALFLIVGMLYERRHTRLIEDFGGLASVVPVLAGTFLIASLASLGLPGLNGFVGEFLVLIGTFTEHRLWAILAAFGVILAAIYLLWAYQRVMWGPLEREENKKIPDLGAREKLLLAPVLGLILVLGVWPRPLLDRMEPSLERVLERVESATPAGVSLSSVGGR
ncbi:MAG: NADH-quinone oxidoreductase subunit M [Actinomycetota bacterium]